jgi:hypothetical protein
MTASRQALQSMLDQLDILQIEADRRAATVRAARRLNRGSALLAASVLMDSAVEHYRGSFANRAMYTPLLVSALTLAFSAHGTTDRRPDVHRGRHGAAVAAAATGLAGTGFHIWNVLKRPGRLDWQNLFYGAPVGAPMAILLAGLLGTAAEWVRDTPGHHADGGGGSRVPCLGHSPSHGRVAKLAAECRGRAAAAGATQLYRPGFGRARRARTAVEHQDA